MKKFIVFLTVTLSLFADASDLRKVKLQLLWIHQFEFAGFYMAKEKGFYKDIGLSVEISDGFKKNTIEDVDRGAADFGVAGSKIVYEAIKGKSLVALAPIFQNSPYAWVTKKDSNISTLHDFVGKTVMHSEHSLDNIELIAMLKAADVDISKIDFIPTSYNIHDLMDGKCDVASAYVSNEPYELEEAGVEYKLFYPVEQGVDFYGDILFTSQKFLDANPELVKEFRDATLKGWRYAFENIEETIHIIHEKYNPSKTLGHLRYEASILKQQSLYPFVAIGTMNETRWQQIADTFMELNYLESSKLPEEFIYRDNENRMMELIQKWVVIVTAILSFITIAVIILIRKHNKYLRRVVHERTKEIEAQKKNYETLFSKSVDGIVILQDSRFVKANKAMLDILRYESMDELLEKKPSDISPKYQPDGELSEVKAQKLMERCMREGTCNFQWVHVKKDGEKFWCDISLTKIMFNEKESIHVIWRDITRQKDLEEHLEQEVAERTKKLELAMRTKSDFLANMSHEIRTPLNAIIGFVDLLFRDEDDSDKKKKLHIIKESGYSLLTIINDILDFSKIENGRLLIERIPFNISDTFNSVVELFFSKAKEKGVTIKISLDEKLPQYTLGDSVRVKQVFSNILSNAIKFTPEDRTIEIKIKYLDEKNELYCEVQDHGIGIASAKIESVFKSFVQEDSSTTRKFGGTGLGLSISKALVELMGGNIGVKSEVGEGSLFYFTLPLYAVDEDMIESEIVEVKERVMDGNVLVVEDNKSNQLLMGILLDELGVKSDIANDGLEAVEIMQRENSYDLILMDENMPNMNGIEATKKIRTNSRSKNIPIVAVTANALKGDREKFLEAGMDDYISKPINSAKLEEVLRKYL